MTLFCNNRPPVWKQKQEKVIITVFTSSWFQYSQDRYQEQQSLPSQFWQLLWHILALGSAHQWHKYPSALNHEEQSRKGEKIVSTYNGTNSKKMCQVKYIKKSEVPQRRTHSFRHHRHWAKHPRHVIQSEDQTWVPMFPQKKGYTVTNQVTLINH